MQLVEALVGQAGVVGKLVEDRAADLGGQVGRVGEVVLERDAEERDLVGEGHHVRSPLDRRYALVQSVEPAILIRVTKARLLVGGHVIDDDGNVLQEPMEGIGQLVEVSGRERRRGASGS